MIPNDYHIEAAHLNLHINQENTSNLVFSVIGHISAVDPTTNQIKVVIPTWTNDNNTFMESGWVPLGTMAAGNQFGIQLLPFGGATPTDITGQQNSQNGNQPAAEQVLVHVLGRKKGLYVVGVQTFNTVDVPPTGYQDPSGIQAGAGEWLFKHASGGYLYFSNDNTVSLVSYTNPAPVLQSNQPSTSVDQSMTVAAKADGGNVSGTPQVSSSLNLQATATGGTVNKPEFTLEATTDQIGQAQGTINVDASTLGTAELNINVKGTTSTLNILLDGETNTFNLTVTEGIVNVISDVVNVDSLEVNVTSVATTVETTTCDITSAGNTTITAAQANIIAEAVILGNGDANPVITTAGPARNVFAS